MDERQGQGTGAGRHARTGGGKTQGGPRGGAGKGRARLLTAAVLAVLACAVGAAVLLAQGDAPAVADGQVPEQQSPAQQASERQVPEGQAPEGQEPEAAEGQGAAGPAEEAPAQPPDKGDADAYDDWLLGLDGRYFLEHVGEHYSGNAPGIDDALATATEEDIETAAAYYKGVVMFELADEQGRELTRKEKDHIARVQELLFGESADWLHDQGADVGAAQEGGATAPSDGLTVLGGSGPVPGDPDYQYDGPFVGTYPIEDDFVKGRVLVTDDGAFGWLPTGHAAMTYDKQYNKAITAMGGASSGSGSSGGSSAGGSSSGAVGEGTGVVLEDNDWNHRHATCFVVDVIGTDEEEEAAVADWCHGHLGKPYSIEFFDTASRDTFYCSKLVWAGFLDCYGIDLNTEEYSIPGVGDAVHPMELVRTPLTRLLYQHGDVADAETGWLDISGRRYYVDELGQPLAGLQVIDGSTYCFRTGNGLPSPGPEYSMVTGKQYVGGTYYAGEDGQYHSTGSGGHWYYFNASGAALSGWRTIGGSEHYFRHTANWASAGPKYSAVTGPMSLGGFTYSFGSDGVLLSCTSNGPDLLTTYGVRDGSAGPDFLGISNTNFDFTLGSPFTNTQYTGMTSMQLSTARGAGLAIWATSVNEETNLYYQNLYYDIALALTPAPPHATTWMSNPIGSWGDSNGTASNKYNVSTGAPTIAGLEYDPEIIFGANKLTNWQDELPDGSNSQTVTYNYLAGGAEPGYEPTFTSNDATNIWTQVYTMGRLAEAAENLKAVHEDKETRYGNDAVAAAVDYEKAIRGNLLYVASQIDLGNAQRKTVAYLYSIDQNGVGYFFTPQASGLLVGDDTGAPPTSVVNYAANNGTIGYGYRATLPFVTDTFDSGTPFYGGIVMWVENIRKSNPACIVPSTATGALAGVDTVIYNTTLLTDPAGVTDGRNSSGVGISPNYQANDFALVSNWLAARGLPATSAVIAGDDFGTSSSQGFGTVNTTATGMSPLLYCQRNYTADKNAKAAWAFARVYPELYGGNPDATYCWWVDRVYHVRMADVPTVARYMLNKTGAVTYGQATAALLEACFAAGHQWWEASGSTDPYWSQFAYYNGSSRASYYSDDPYSEEAEDEIGIFAPSVFW
ncbi:MAG: hypothetical protein LBL86_11620 [Coriobacteriales bacterium]|jgi:uncharacterized protein YycO|nr:hypothetical protein [Coriobacteriales bacterium]